MKEIRKIRHYLIDKAEKESKRLYRMAWRAKAHGCSDTTVEAIRNEARELYMTGHPERLLTRDYIYAFKG